jgi:tetrapyrrole methylase family protein/MazG family protein
MPATITIAGLGPGDPGARTVAVERALHHARRIVLRTAIHPGLDDLLADPRVSACDDLYETLGTFDEVYAAVAQRVLDTARDGDVVFGVPGHPSFGERSVRLVVERAPIEGFQVDVLPAVGAPEAIAAAVGADLLAGEVQFLDAIELRSIVDAEPFAAGRLTLDPARPCLVGQVYDHDMAVATKLALSRLYPDEHDVAVVTAAGVAGVERLVRCPLRELDRQDVDHLTSVWVPALPPLDAVRSEQALRRIVARLRAPGGCPWDQEQTSQTLRSATIEEAFEVVDAIDADDPEALCEELGDLLANVLMHAQFATEAGHFGIEDVVEGITRKLIRRHPHVFGDLHAETSAEVLTNWNRIKDEERRSAGKDGRGNSLIERLPRSMPALLRAVEVLKSSGDRAVALGMPTAEAVGDHLLAAVESAVAAGFDPEVVLEGALRRRFASEVAAH